MRKVKNVFLTTLEHIKYREDIAYYSCENAAGQLSFTSGVSVTEAGIKYMLSRQAIDQIVVIGPASCAHPDELARTPITGVSINNISDLYGMSDYGFLCYRLAEHLHQIDFELIDISEGISEGERSRISEMLRAFRSAHAPAYSFRDLFIRLSANNELESLFQSEILDGLSLSGKKWARHYLFSQTDSFYKLHQLDENRNTEIRFLPVSIDGVISIESVTDTVREALVGEEVDIRLFMDLQGINAVDGNLLINTFLLLNKRIGYHCDVAELIKTEKAADRFCGKVFDVRKSYDIQKLMSGIDLFLEYGKDKPLKQFWATVAGEDPIAGRLFTGMDLIDEGITLCNIDIISCGINVIRRVIASLKNNSDEQSIYLKILIDAIRADYGPLLEDGELNIPELLKWSHRKGLYQQTLTIIESRVPDDIVRRGIYYYAENKKDIKGMIEALNLLYWTEPARMRYSFNEIDHYFIKFYGRFALDYRQKPDAVAKDYASLRIDALHGRAPRLRRAFSLLNDDKLLYELLLSYYKIGNLRNQVNHASVDEAAVESEGEIRRKDSRGDLDIEINRFINLYCRACGKVSRNRKPMLLPARKFKAYARYHELQPLEMDSDLIHKNRYVCSFDGKNVLIDIRLLKTEEDYGTED